MGKRKFGWHSGQVRALNIKSGTLDMNTDAGGDAETSVTFTDQFKARPSVVLTPREVMTTGVLSVTSGDISSFKAHMEGSSLTSDTITVDWIAIDQTK